MTKKLFVVLVVVSAMLISFSLVLAAKDAGLRHTPDTYVKTYSSMRHNATVTPMPQPSISGTMTPLSLFPPVSTSALQPDKDENYQIPHHEIPPSILRQEGGETCASATVISSLPLNATGNTCDNVNDYEEVGVFTCPYASTSPDVVYSYTPSANEVINIDMWTSAYDTKIWVYEDNCVTANLVACNDDYYSNYVSAIFQLAISVGHTYYIVVDGYGGDCGDYVILVELYQPCDVVCPSGGIPEGEPTCYDNYVDSYNGGCNSTPNVFQTVNLGNVICGTSGTYLFGASNYRDTDWFRVVLTSPTTLSWKVVAEFPVLIFIMNAGTENCSDYTILGNTTAAACDTAFLSFAVPAGVYWLWVGPSVFTGYPCGLEYVGIVGGAAATGCCQLTGSCAEMTEADCITAGGTWYADPYTCVGTTCQPPAPDSICHLQWDNGTANWYASSFGVGSQQGNYFNPATMCPDCGPDVYPFQITQVSGLFYDFASVGSVDVIVHIYSVGDDTCSGPGTDIYQFATTITTFYPDEAVVPLPEVLCVEEDFIVAFELNSGTEGSIPCVLWTSEAIQNCISWVYHTTYSPPWYAMEDMWGGVGYHMIRADGICNAGACNPGEECNMQQDNGTAQGYASWIWPGFQIAKWYDPEVYCTAPVYPYHISAVDFPLYLFTGAADNVNMKIAVYLTCEDSCDGPGTQIYLSPLYNLTTFYPSLNHIELDQTICVYEPFYVALIWQDGPTPMPSFLMDSFDGIPYCHQWFYDPDVPEWVEHYDWWGTPGTVGMGMLRVSGFTEAPNCDPPSCDTTIEQLYGATYAAYYWKQPPNDEFLNMKFEMPSDHGGRLEAFQIALYWPSAHPNWGSPDPDFYVWLSDGTYPLDNNPPYQAIANFHLDYSQILWYPNYNYVATYSNVLEFEPGEMFHIGYNHAHNPGDTLSILSNDGGEPGVANNSGGWYNGAWESYSPYAFLIDAFICPYAPEAPTFTMQCKPALGYGTPGDPPANVFTVGLIPVIGYNLPVTLSLLSVTPPASITAAFNPNPATPPDTADVAITVGVGVPYGDYVLVFQGVGSDNQTKVCNVTLTVQPPFDEAVVNFFHGQQRTSNFGAVGNDASTSNFVWYGTNYLFDGSFMSATTGPDHMAMDVYNCTHYGFIPSQHVVVTHMPWCPGGGIYEENYGEVAYSNFYTEESTISCEYDSLFVIGLSDVASTDFSIKIKIYYNPTTTPIPELHIGLFEDWDIGDAYNNWVDMDTQHNIIWQFDPVDPSIVFGMFKAPFYDEPMLNMVAVRNPVYVWPGAGFCDPGSPESLDSLYLLMTRPGYTYATMPDTDFSLLMCPPPFSLNPGEKHIEVWFDFGRNLNDGFNWEQWQHKLLRYAGFYRGDVNASDTLELPALDVSDLVYLINYLYQAGPAPQPFADQADVDGKGPGGASVCDNLDPLCPKENVDVSDLVYLINYMWKNGPPPVDRVRFIEQCWTRPSLFTNPNW